VSTSSSALLVLAGSFDMEAATFVEASAAANVVRITPRDLSRDGWTFRSGDASSAVAVSGSRRLARKDIRGLLPRLSHVDESQLPHIAQQDRAYVASEMTAFLLAFLSAFDGEVHNRPTPQCLCGPLWSAERWRRLAAALGIPVRFQRRVASREEITPSLDQRPTAVTLVGDVVFGDTGLGPAVVALARAAGAEMLRAEFVAEGADMLFWNATPLVNLADRDIAEAALALFPMRVTALA
jgi:hypothetical protein